MRGRRISTQPPYPIEKKIIEIKYPIEPPYLRKVISPLD